MNTTETASPQIETIFSDLGIEAEILERLTKQGFTKPTPIQGMAIPVALQGKDILGSAQTGTGKTLAFGIPLLTHLMKNPDSHALVMTPTRELATQVLTELNKIQGKPSIPSVSLIGGEPIGIQFRKLRDKPRIFVGTPGRIRDHLERRKFLLENVDFLVLDETDRMLDMGFAEQIKFILDEISEKRQTLMFSATIPKEIDKIARTYLVEPERVSVGTPSRPVDQIKQDAMFVSIEEKYPTLLKQLEERTGSVIVFVRTKRGADKLAKRLFEDDQSAHAIHGDLQQRKRERVLDSFRAKKHRVLVATDVAARGLDIPHVEHVVNYDLPQSPEDYVHRIGRTARAGAVGSALNLIAPNETYLWKDIQRFLSPKSSEGESRPGGRSFQRKGRLQKASEGRPRFGKGRFGGNDRREENPGNSRPSFKPKAHTAADERPRGHYSDARPPMKSKFKKDGGTTGASKQPQTRVYRADHVGSRDTRPTTKKIFAPAHSGSR